MTYKSYMNTLEILQQIYQHPAVVVSHQEKVLFSSVKHPLPGSTSAPCSRFSFDPVEDQTDSLIRNTPGLVSRFSLILYKYYTSTITI